MKFFATLALSVSLLGCQHLANRSPSSELRLQPRYKADKLATIANQHALIVVHATTEFDQHRSAAAGIDQLVREFKAKGRPVIYLVSDQSENGYRHWYTADRSPDFEIFSEGGEHNLPIALNEVTVVGGFWGSTDTMNGCQTLAVKDAIRMHFEVSKAPLTVHMPLQAIYFYPDWEPFRQEMLNTRKINLNSLSGVKPFASIFFLREGNNGAGDDGNEQNFAHYYTGKENKNYRSGEEVSRLKYQFNFYLDDKVIETLTGSGKRVVNLKMETF